MVDNKLEISTSLFTELHDHGVAYCHWKSNEHLGAALRGETDLDLLVGGADREKFRACLTPLGFIPVLSPPIKRVVGVEDFLGFDQETGSLLHLDVSYRLILGELRIKNHHLPLEDWLLTGATNAEGVGVPSPAREFLLLYVRAMLKASLRTILLAAFRGVSPLSERLQRELMWLAAQVDAAQLANAAETSALGISGDEIVDFHTRALQNRIGWSYVFGKKRSLLRRLRGFERYPRYTAIPRKVWLYIRYSRPVQRLGREIPRKRLHGRAPLVAVVGADGAGKTRLTKDLVAWLRWKLAARHVYFGQPKSSFLFKLLSKIESSSRRRNTRHGGTGPVSRLPALIQRYADAARWILLARRRAHLASRVQATCESGEPVIAERYPLRQFRGMRSPMDGPRLQNPTTGALSRWFARTEMKSYDSIHTPDLVIVLKASLGTLRDRKLDLTMEEHAAKVEAVQQLRSGDGLVIIDADRPYGDVLLGAKREVWRVLREAR